MNKSLKIVGSGRKRDNVITTTGRLQSIGFDMTDSFIPSQMERWGEKVADIKSHAELAREEYLNAQDRLREGERDVDAVEETQTIAQTIAQNIQEQVHSKIAGVVSRCLSAVFEEPYEFKINFERKRGRTEAQLIFEREGMQIDPMTASGGGPVDLAAFALRLSCMMLARPQLRRVLIMDEPFKSPSPHYREKVKMLMETLSKEMGVQFIMVTNIMELVAGDVIDLGE